MSGLGPERPVGGLAVPRPPGVELRPLSRDDFAIAQALIRELYGIARSADEEPHRARYERLINHPDSAPFLAVADGEPAGLILFSFRRRLNHATFEGWVSDLYVRPPHRRRGIARALLFACLAEWRLRRGHQVMLEVAHGNEPARALYAASGFTERGLFFQQRPVRPRRLEPAADVEIRPIRPDDVHAVTRLLAELGRPAPTEEQLPAVERTYRDHLRRAASGSTGSLIAARGGEPLGFVSLEFREPYAFAAPQAWIPDLIVAERARGSGVGAALLDAAITAAAAGGAYAVVLESGFQRREAHRLYERAGMTSVGSFWTLRRDDG
jgi:ribosomal protein S18 acetylase RimI-like enzyme